jgi:DNA repair exonuclease SbcCD ATPase subunit
VSVKRVKAWEGCLRRCVGAPQARVVLVSHPQAPGALAKVETLTREDSLGDKSWEETKIDGYMAEAMARAVEALHEDREGLRRQLSEAHAGAFEEAEVRATLAELGKAREDATSLREELERVREALARTEADATALREELERVKARLTDAVLVLREELARVKAERDRAVALTADRKALLDANNPEHLECALCKRVAVHLVGDERVCCVHLGEAARQGGVVS